MAGILEFDYRTGSAEDFARALFDRTVTPLGDKEAITSGPFDPECGDTDLVRLCTELFERFGELSQPYSDEQIDQGLWMICGDPYFLVLFHLADEGTPVGVAVKCVRACYHLYADYLAPQKSRRHAGALYIWWDQSWSNASSNFGAPRREVVEAVFETLARILALDDSQCRNSALHGLHHLEEAMGLPVLVAALDGIEDRLGIELTDSQRTQLHSVLQGFHPGDA